MRVLIFDDVLFHRQGDFAVSGAELRFFKHADDAVALVSRLVPDLVLMDYAMDARLSGDEAITQLRGRWPSGALRIVGISADGGSNRMMLAAGADDAVLKSGLRGLVRAELSRRGSRPEPARDVSNKKETE